MVDESLGEETAAVATLEDTGAEVDVFAVTHGGEATQRLIDAFLDTKVETAGVELVQLFLPASDATRGEKRGHGVIDGLLYGRE